MIDIKKIIRLFIGSLAFLCMTTIIGLNMRQGHQLFFALAVMILFSLIVKNVWLTLFMWLAIALFTIFKFECGKIYITNIFYGSVLYYLTKLAFEKKHIDWFINIFLWMVFANLAYSILQVLRFDFVYHALETLQIGNKTFNGTVSPNGFMGNSGITAFLYCMAIPFIATRSRNSFWLSLFLLIPIFILHSFISMIASALILLFLLWFRVSKKLWFTALVLLILMATAYLIYFDIPGFERIAIWRGALADCNVHPVLGWGMDSFRKFTEGKQFLYWSAPVNGCLWDNPHNLYISLWYEFGFIALILLGGYVRQLILWFKNSMKDNNTIALAGFLLGFFILSGASFPAFLCRTMIFIIPVFALYEVSANG